MKSLFLVSFLIYLLEKISKYGAFSSSGDLFTFKMSRGNFLIVNSSNFENLIELRPIKSVQKSSLKGIII